MIRLDQRKQNTENSMNIRSTGMKETRKTAQNFQELIVWQKAHQFVLKVYTLTKEFPQAEIFGLTPQLRRPAVSVAANSADGFKRKGAREKARYFNIAQASLEESRYYLLLKIILSSKMQC